MSFIIPTPQELRDEVYSELEANLPSSNPRQQQSFLNAIGKMVALATSGLYIYLSYIFKQIFVTTADSEFLEQHGSPLGIDRLEATQSTGNTGATGTNGTIIPLDTQLQKADGTKYRVTTGQTIALGVAVLPLEAIDFGVATNADAGTALTFVSPIAGVDSGTVVDGSGLVGGADSESDEAYKARILERKRQPPQGGAEIDYITWAKQVAGVTRAWATGLVDGLGSVRVTFMVGEDIPSAGEVTAVEDYINGVGRRPVTADALVLAPVAQPIAFDITITPDNPDVRLAVENELNDMILRDAYPDGTILISKIREAVSTASGELDNVVNSPTADVPATSDIHIHTVGTISFT